MSPTPNNRRKLRQLKGTIRKRLARVISDSRVLGNRQVASRRQGEGGKVDDLVVWDAVDVEFLQRNVGAFQVVVVRERKEEREEQGLPVQARFRNHVNAVPWTGAVAVPGPRGTLRH